MTRAPHPGYLLGELGIEAERRCQGHRESQDKLPLLVVLARDWKLLPAGDPYKAISNLDSAPGHKYGRRHFRFNYRNPIGLKNRAHLNPPILAHLSKFLFRQENIRAKIRQVNCSVCLSFVRSMLQRSTMLIRFLSRCQVALPQPARPA